MPAPPRRLAAVLAGAAAVVVLVVLAGGVAVWWIGRGGAPGDGAPRAAVAPDAATAAPATGAPDAPGSAPDAPAGSLATPADERAPEADPMDDLDQRALAWSAVDLDAVRAALPDNLYWKLGAPTKDPELLRWREEERARWNVQYGKVLSNTATAEEVETYYADRKRVSEDYVAFAGYLLLYYRDQLPKQDVGLLKLAMDMHLARLEEIPRQIAEAHQRREAHDAVRRAWLAEQKAFEGDAPTR